MSVRCYFENCKIEVSEDNEHYPFCSAKHHNAWADANYGKTKNGKSKLTIPEMQKRLLQMGKKKGQNEDDIVSQAEKIFNINANT